MQNVYRWTGSITGQPSTIHMMQATFVDTCSATSAVGDPGPTNRPRVLALAGAVPNPFTRSTRLDFEIPVSGHVKLVVYSVTGQRTQTLIDGFREAGRGSAIFDGRGLQAGIYYVRLETPSGKLVRSVMLLR
jgi:hypothetical protein